MLEFRFIDYMFVFAKADFVALRSEEQASPHSYFNSTDPNQFKGVPEVSRVHFVGPKSQLRLSL